MDQIEYKIGPMTVEDYDKLRKNVGWLSYSNEEIEQGLKNTLFTVTANYKNSAIAMGRVIGDGKMVFYIQDIIVLPEYQRKGIGKTIMNMIMDYIDEHSVNNSIIGLMASIGKEKFYEDFGFIKRPNDKMGCGMNIWVRKFS